MRREPWEALETRARMVLDCVIADLPPELKAEADKVPCLLQTECEHDPGLLGYYGHFEPGMVSEANGPIVLYLETIAEYCDEEQLNFDQEVRLTYLHELGHHLGWDEGDLEARGLG